MFDNRRQCIVRRGLLVLAMAAIAPAIHVVADTESDFEAIGVSYRDVQRPLLRQFCLDCHSTADVQGELDLEQFASLQEVRTRPAVWQKVAEMLDNGEMPPKDADQPTPSQRQELREWVRRYLDAEALANAGDPGPVVLRRLSNAEYTYTIQDLTGVPLTPAREFPVDSASGEGFTNTGNSLVMSPALVTKYLDAARGIADHAVLLPSGFRFSRFTTRRDWTNEKLDDIRDFYAQYSDSGGGDTVNLQGIVFDTNGGGRLPLAAYLTALLSHRTELRNGDLTVDDLAQMAREKSPRLSSRYLGRLWQVLEPADGSEAEKNLLLLKNLRQQWKSATQEDVPELVKSIAQWQQALWRFTTVGHIGKLNGPTAWMEPVSPVTTRQEIRVPLASPPNDGGSQQTTDGDRSVVLYLVTGDAGDGSEHDVVLWERPRLVTPGRPDLLLKDVRTVTHQLAAMRERIFSSAARCLAAAAQASDGGQVVDGAVLAAEHAVDAASLTAWLDYLGIGSQSAVNLGTPVSRRIESASGYDFIQGWGGDDALSIVANSSDEHVRIPGNMAPHSVAVHPAPTLSIGVGWRSPVASTLTIEGTVQHAHPECGNGTAWSVELRRGNTRQRLADGISHGATVVTFGPLTDVAIQKGDVVCLVVNPRDGNHSCDLTAINMTLRDARNRWNLADDLSPDLLSGNPHADRQGNADVWHFFSEPADGKSGSVIPEGSLLARWQKTSDAAARGELAAQLQQLLNNGSTGLPADAPDAVLYRQLTSLSGPLLSAAITAAVSRTDQGDEPAVNLEHEFGLDAQQFGRHPAVDNNVDQQVPGVDAASLCVTSPSVIEVRLPADLVAGAEFVTSAVLHPVSGREGSVQMQVLTTKPEPAGGLQPTAVTATESSGPWTSHNSGIAWATPIIVTEGSAARERIEASFEEFRQLFPAALCYTKIVPVDEVVTLTLFYREDDQLRRLILNDEETAALNRHWDELHYVSRDALMLVDAFEQLMEFATQDADPGVFAPMKEPIQRRAAEFRELLRNSESSHVEALVRFAARASRRRLSSAEEQSLRTLYGDLRSADLSHEEAFEAVLHKILVSPAFLYRLETPGSDSQASPVTDWELASRLSYFLWSSAPDDELLRFAEAGTLSDPDVLESQARRMLQDDRTRRLATEFMCQWLHIYDFDQLDEKSERHFPTFASVRPLLYEEAILFFTDLLQNDGSVVELFDADHTFVNAELAAHYGMPGIAGNHWRRVDGTRKFSRGGIFGLGATLAKQSGASRTSPILRGNWLSEVILGEKLPRPPKDVPLLPEDEAAETLTVRELVERHTSDERCSGCHRRIDPYGFSLEAFDAIGRYRTTDLGGRPVDTTTTLMDGTGIDGFEDLKKYLLTQRRDAVLHQFCRKLLGYALGRSVQLSDQPLLKEMQHRLQENDYHISAAIIAVVSSPQFQNIRGRSDVASAD
ncbi:MAG: DUF1592 domain-containing protein [Planctomycetaceae bacterium]